MLKTNIEIVGLGNRMKGTSAKSGKPYDFQSVSFLYTDRFTTGQKAAACNMEGVDIDNVGGLVIGCFYPAVLDEDRKDRNIIRSVCLL